MSQAKLHVKKGDTVLVLSGKDKGKQGKILQAMPAKDKVVVEGVNKLNVTLNLIRKLQTAVSLKKKLLCLLLKLW